MGASAVAMTAQSSLPQPILVKDFPAAAISPDGKMIAGSLYGTVKIYNINDCTTKVFESEDDPFTLGLGNSLSATGVALICYSDTVASYYENGEIKKLSVPQGRGLWHSANGITPDAKRICGNVGTMGLTTDDAMMNAPAYWERQPDGTYGTYNILPHPTVDFTGRVPQYCSALWISEDGRTIAGQLTDWSGYLQMPIIYRQNDANEWTYELLHPELFNPDNVVFPEWPGNSPKAPEVESFMSAAEKEAYDTDYADWEAAGFDYSMWPDPMDYLSDEEKAAYDAAEKEYNSLQDAWNAKSAAFDEVFIPLLDKTPAFVFNSYTMQPDGSHVAYADQFTPPVEGDPYDPEFEMPETEYSSWAFATNGSDDFTKYSTANANPTCYAADGTLFTANEINLPGEAYVVVDGKEISVYDWLKTSHPEYAEWMDKNLRHTFESMDWLTGETTTYDNVLITGAAYVTPDMGTLILSMNNTWDYNELDNQAQTVIFSLNGKPLSGIDTPASDLAEPAETDNTIYDLMGRKLNDTNRRGLYIVGGKKVIVK